MQPIYMRVILCCYIFVLASAMYIRQIQLRRSRGYLILVEGKDVRRHRKKRLQNLLMPTHNSIP